MEGQIKFDLAWKDGPAPSEDEILELQLWRQRLHALKLIGVDAGGVGYGNISIRTGSDFIISATQTGALTVLCPSHYTKVVLYAIEQGFVSAVGPAKPSSEALSHAACYNADPRIRGVIHVHHTQLWRSLLETGLRTSAAAAYGSPELAKELAAILTSRKGSPALIGVAGHTDGVFAVGDSLTTAGDLLLDKFSGRDIK